MEFLSKIASLLFILFLLFLWNKFVVPFLVKLITSFHKRNNKQNLNRQPIKFVIENELKIIRFIQVFYWIGGILLLISGIINTNTTA